MATPVSALHPPRSEEESALAVRYGGLPADVERRKAFEAFSKTGLPHRRLEGWRWSDVRAALKFATAESEDDAKAADLFAPLGGTVFEFRDIGADIPPDGAGVRVTKSSKPELMDWAGEAPLAALAVALSDAPAAIGIEIGKGAGTVRLSFISGSPGQSRHIRVRVLEGVEATVAETYLGARAFTNVTIEYMLDPGAVLNRLTFQSGGKSAVQASTAHVRLGKGARLVQTALAFGARLARLETRVTHEAGGSEAILNGAYLVRDGLHADLTSHVVHEAPGCVTRQTVKGAARKGGHGVFQGKFLVERAAQKTDAKMQHHALLLEDGAEVNAKPELEIYADDVQCAHGNTAGAINADALFYLRQRGLPEHEARAMLTESFIAEAFAAAEPSVADLMMREARRWLLAPS